MGGARTALYNLLFARREKGHFILRIEDTDVERSREELSQQILAAMEWLGLSYDEGPYYQSKRYDLYRAAVERLLAEGKAYRAFETPEELEIERKKAEAEGRAYRYSGAGREISPEESERRARAGERHVVRLKMPAETIVVDDLIRGRVDFPAEALDDFVLVRSDGHPLYHFCVVVDDVDMKITHVIRGDDHISNTPKHVLLFQAFGVAVPRFAHVPLILGADKKRLSKRHGATSVMEYARQGYVPDALVNFLALLGWSPGDDRELMSRRELIESFALEGISGGNAVFDTAKLDWMNGQYIARMPIQELADLVVPLLRKQGLWPEHAPADEPRLRLLELLRPRAKRLTHFVEQARPFLVETVEYEQDAIDRHLATPGLSDHVAALIAALKATSPFDEPHVEAAVRRTAEQREIKAGQLIHATRVAATGRTASPGIFEVLVLLGRERTIRRLERLVAFLATQNLGRPERTDNGRA